MVGRCSGNSLNRVSWNDAMDSGSNLSWDRHLVVLPSVIVPSDVYWASLWYSYRIRVIYPYAWLLYNVLFIILDCDCVYMFSLWWIRCHLPNWAWCGSASCTSAESFLLYRIFTRCTSPYTPKSTTNTQPIETSEHSDKIPQQFKQYYNSIKLRTLLKANMYVKYSNGKSIITEKHK